jgi:hypothetical protein
VPVSAFSAGPASPLLSLASDGAYWLAAANPDPGADPLTPGVAGATGPAATAGGDASVGPPASVQDGRDALWLSLNGGSAWQLLNTSAAPWLGAEQTELDLVGFVPAPTPSAPSARHAAEAATTSTTAGGSSPGAANVPAAVVVGTVDGQLAVWVGTAAQPSSSSTTG